MNKFLGIAALGAVLALPTASFASTFAYVNTAGEVSSVEADTAAMALTTAPSIGLHSGVMLVSSDDDGIVGSSVR